MAIKKNTKKIAVSKQNPFWMGLKSFGDGILRFFAMLYAFILKISKMAFDFIINVLTLLPEVLKFVLWFIVSAGIITFLFGILAIYSLSALGIKESPQWQEYRENVLEHAFIELAEDDCEGEECLTN